VGLVFVGLFLGVGGVYGKGFVVGLYDKLFVGNVFDDFVDVFELLVEEYCDECDLVVDFVLVVWFVI